MKNIRAAVSAQALLLIVLIILLLGGVGPWWGYSHSWGYGPFGGIIGLILLLVLLRAFGIIVIVAGSCMFYSSCATDTGDPKKDRQGRIANAVGEEVFNAVFKIAMASGQNAIAGRNGQDAAGAIFENVASIDGGAALSHIITAAAGPEARPVATEAARQFSAADPQTPAEKQFIVNTIGAAVQTAANIKS
jgi:uncharacterized membrane protein